MVSWKEITEWFPAVCRVIRWFKRRKPKVETRLTVLIVEDNADDARLLYYWLAELGLKAEIAASGEVAAGLVKHTFYPVVFVDMRLPGMPGEVFLQILSADSPSARSVVVCGEARDLERLPKSQFLSGVIIKPVTKVAVADMIRVLGL